MMKYVVSRIQFLISPLAKLVLLLLIAACSKQEVVTPVAPSKATYVSDKGSIYFKIIPTSSTELDIQFFLPANTRNLTKVFLKKDTVTLGAFPVAFRQNTNYFYTASIQYKFTQGEHYNFVVQSEAVADTVYRYTVSNYAHNFKSIYAVQKIMDVKGFIGFNAFDISPSRNYIFITDYPVIKRLSLQTLAVDVIDAGLSSLAIRAASDNEVLTQETYLNNHYLKDDSAALMKYNLDTKKSTFVDWVDNTYQRTSRVVNNHILISNVVYTKKSFQHNGSLINLIDNSKISYDTINPSSIRESNFDNLYYYNTIIDPNTGMGTVPQFPLINNGTVGQMVMYGDPGSGYTIVLDSHQTPDPAILDGAQTRIRVYQKNILVYQDEFTPGRYPQFSGLLSIQNNTIVFYQSFSFSKHVNIDGYYSLDLTSGQVSLLHCYSSPTAFTDFQFSPNLIVSVKPDGIYKLTR